MRSGDSLGVVYDRASLKGSLDYRRSFGGVGGTGARGTMPVDLEIEFDAAQDDPLLLALVALMRKKAEDEAVRYYATSIGGL